MTGYIERRDEAGGVRRLTLNRPQERNALSLAMLDALGAEIAAIAADPSVRVVVLAAAGPVFCAGHDLKELRQNRGEAGFVERLFGRCGEVMLAITRLPQPVIAQVQGVATAAGCQLVATCDLAVAADQARFATPGVNIGLFCSTPMVALSRAVPRKVAMKMLLTGEMLSAEQAQAFGLINDHVPAEQLEQAVAELAGLIASKSAQSIAFGKRAFYDQLERGLDDAYAFAGAVMVRNMLAGDATEGIDAFLEKRTPCWGVSA